MEGLRATSCSKEGPTLVAQGLLQPSFSISMEGDSSIRSQGPSFGNSLLLWKTFLPCFYLVGIPLDASHNQLLVFSMCTFELWCLYSYFLH